jgi:hypothetical protein
MSFVITLSRSSHRGRIVRSAETRRDAFEIATALLDEAAASHVASAEMVSLFIIEEGYGAIEETIAEAIEDMRRARRDRRSD